MVEKRGAAFTKCFLASLSWAAVPVWGRRCFLSLSLCLAVVQSRLTPHMLGWRSPLPRVQLSLGLCCGAPLDANDFRHKLQSGGKIQPPGICRFGTSILHGNLIIKWVGRGGLLVARWCSGASNKRGLTPIFESGVFMKSKRSVLRHNPGWGSLGGDLGGPRRRVSARLKSNPD